ncbi:MAG: type II toxin-antitoxin system HicA family toxin [Candidatus Berkelbacteria bacterium]|nr:type II toxin-antitoxin system HicA family toxin [Candidatus Berkelbacteria bacterium]
MIAKYSQISAKTLLKVLVGFGFKIVGQKGSHIKLEKTNGRKKVLIVPNHKFIKPGTLNNILKFAELDKKDLDKIK